MDFQNKKIKKFISSLIIIFMLVPALTFFVAPKKTYATGWPVVDIIGDALHHIGNVFQAKTSVDSTASLAIQIKQESLAILQQLLKIAAQKALQRMTQSTINWINSGFHGSPLFVQNPGSFFKDIGKTEIKTFVDETGYDSNRFPFGKNFALNVISSYKNQFTDNAQYSLSKVINDPALLHGYQTDFYVGGWNGFLINTQYPQNNYVGYQILATDELARRLAGTTQNVAQTVQNTLQQGQGFLSPQVCTTTPGYDANPFSNPPTFDISKFSNNYYSTHSPPWDNTDYENALDQAKADWAKTNVCQPKADGTTGLQNTTPGAVLAGIITDTLNKPQDQTSWSAQFGNSLSAIFDSLLNHFTQSGLNALATKFNPPAPQDTWSYMGQTFGSPIPDSQSIWSGPDQEVVLSDLKQKVADGITNTSTELKLMDNNDPNAYGLLQLFSLIWPKVQQLDQCVPGPDLGWEDRLDGETDRNSQLFNDDSANPDPDNKDSADFDQAWSTAARLNAKEFTYTMGALKDWISLHMLQSLPDAPTYLDAIQDDTMYQDSTTLLDAKRSKTSALLRLQTIQASLANITDQPAPGSQQEGIMVDLANQYSAVETSISNSTTIENTVNELNTYKEKYFSLKDMVTQCTQERTAAQWAAPDPTGKGTARLLADSNPADTEIANSCFGPATQGYDHEGFVSQGGIPNGDLVQVDSIAKVFQAGGVSSGHFFVDPKNINFRTIDTAPFKIPIAYAAVFFDYKTTLILEGYTKPSCDIIFKSTTLDYKQGLPTEPTLAEPTNNDPYTLPPSTAPADGGSYVNPYGSSGTGGAAADVGCTAANTHTALTPLDHATLATYINASFKGWTGTDDSQGDIDYWVGHTDHYGAYSDGICRAGWNAYEEQRLKPGNDGSSDPSLGDKLPMFLP